MDVETLEILASARGTAVLAEAGRGVADGAEDLQILTRLRRTWPGPLAAAALTQTRLRVRATTKFGVDAAGMFFTAEGLEQATRPAVAQLRARRYAAAGADRVLDLCCGIGSDALALAGAAGLTVRAVDRDPVTAAVCRVNVAVLGCADRIAVEVGDATRADLAGWPAVFCDPARRAGGRRIFDPAAYSPPWSFLMQLPHAVSRTGLKVAPGLDHDRIPADAEAEWVSHEGDVVEAALWFGDLRTGVGRRATLLPVGVSVSGDGQPTPPVGPTGPWLYEPDGAVIRAGLVSAVVTAVDGRLLDSSIAYVTGDRLVATPLATAYQVIDVLPFGLKRLRAALRQLDAGPVTIKKRGTAVQPEQLRRSLRLTGSRHVVVVLTRIAGAQSALLCRPTGR